MLRRNAALVASVAANKHCVAVKDALAACRAQPLGRYVEPEVCRNHAEALIQCHHDVRIVVPACKTSYDSVISCLKAGNYCATQMDGYLECAHPAASKYQKYAS